MAGDNDKLNGSDREFEEYIQEVEESRRKEAPFPGRSYSKEAHQAMMEQDTAYNEFNDTPEKRQKAEEKYQERQQDKHDRITRGLRAQRADEDLRRGNMTEDAQRLFSARHTPDVARIVTDVKKKS